jgi:hypothetical protein
LLRRHLLPGYDYESAVSSPRRWKALGNLDRMVEQDIKDRVEIVSVESAA